MSTSSLYNIEEYLFFLQSREAVRVLPSICIATPTQAFAYYSPGRNHPCQFWIKVPLTSCHDWKVYSGFLFKMKLPVRLLVLLFWIPGEDRRNWEQGGSTRNGPHCSLNVLCHVWVDRYYPPGWGLLGLWGEREVSDGREPVLQWRLWHGLTKWSKLCIEAP